MSLILEVDGTRLIREKIREGTIATDLMKPISVPLYFFSDGLGQTMLHALLVIPSLLFALLLVRIDVPPLATFAAFFVSFLVGYGVIRSSDSILATHSQGTPLLQVDGQDDLGAIQDRIRWDGLRVAYHQINAYRRDQSSQVGTVPKIYNRPAWTVAVGPQEESPIHGDLKFRQKWSPARPAWAFRRDDFLLAPDSPAASAGAELARIPQTPANSW